MLSRGTLLALLTFVIALLVAVVVTVAVVASSRSTSNSDDPTPGAIAPTESSDPACESTPREIVVCLPAGP